MFVHLPIVCMAVCMHVYMCMSTRTSVLSLWMLMHIISFVVQRHVHLYVCTCLYALKCICICFAGGSVFCFRCAAQAHDDVVLFSWFGCLRSNLAVVGKGAGQGKAVIPGLKQCSGAKFRACGLRFALQEQIESAY